MDGEMECGSHENGVMEEPATDTILTQLTEDAPTGPQRANMQQSQNEDIRGQIGEIYFHHEQSDNVWCFRKREFIKVKQDDDLRHTLQYVGRRWDHGNPKLVISLINGYGDDGIKYVTPRVKNALLRDLVNFVLTTGAWLITGGLHSGMTKDVGEALRDCAIGRGLTEHNNVVAIGITPTSILKPHISHFEFEPSLKRKQKPVNTMPRLFIQVKPDDHSRSQLDPNHTKFILVDDDSTEYTRVTLAAQNRFLKAITEKRTAGNEATIPVVCIVVGGSLNQIEGVHQAVVEIKIPVIILDGSGGAADVLAYAYKHMSLKNRNKDKGDSVETMVGFKDKVTKEFDAETITADLKDITEWCRNIADRRSLVTVLSLDESYGVFGSSNLEENILNALLKASKSKTGNQDDDQLYRATALNKIDMAERLLSKKTSLEVQKVRHSLRLALVYDQVNFVQLFLDRGLNLNDYLTAGELTNLYKTISKDTLVYELLVERLEKRSIDGQKVETSLTLKDVGNVINALTTWHYSPLYLENDFQADAPLANPWRELFLWAVLQGRLEMAMLFWREGKAPIGGALVASKILKEMASREHALHETKRLVRYAEGGRLFDQVAVDVLSEFYVSNRKLTSLVLVRSLPMWGSSSCLELADSTSNMKFIAHPAVQNMLKEHWLGKLSLNNPRWKLWVCMLFPPALFYIRLKLKEEEPDPLDVTRLPRGRAEGHIRTRDGTSRRRRQRNVLSVVLENPAPLDETDGFANANDENFTGLPLAEMNRRKKVHVYQQDQPDVQASLSRRIKYFFLVPLVIFLYNALSTIVFLGLFSYVLLEGFMTQYPGPVEYVLLGWFATLCTETIRQIFWEEGPTFWQRLRTWISYFWNMVDISKTVIFIIGYTLRCFPQYMTSGRILLSLSLIIFYMRLPHIFSANKHLGPKVVMIQKMFADLLVFVCILLVFLVAYGVAREAILYPGRAGVKSVLESILYRPYLQIFGELLEDSLEDSECMEYSVKSGNSTHPMIECRQNVWFGTIMLSIYLFLSNVLLLNLLIAMFNYTFTVVQENTDVHWKWQKYKLIKEYYKRPFLPPPFIIVNHVFLLVIWAIKYIRDVYQSCCCCNRCKCRQMSLQTDHRMNELSIWESVKGEHYLTKEKEREQQDINKKMKKNDQRLLELSTQVTKIKEELSSNNEQLKNMQSLLREILGRLNSQRENS